MENTRFSQPFSNERRKCFLTKWKVKYYMAEIE